MGQLHSTITLAARPGVKITYGQQMTTDIHGRPAVWATGDSSADGFRWGRSPGPAPAARRASLPSWPLG